MNNAQDQIDQNKKDKVKRLKFPIKLRALEKKVQMMTRSASEQAIGNQTEAFIRAEPAQALAQY